MLNLGPMPIPIIGNVASFSSSPPPTPYVNWTKIFGNIYTVWLGEMPVVCVNDSKTIYETFVKDGETYAGRAQITEWLEIVKHGQNGIIFSEGEPWREHRRFALRVFRDFGFGKNLMQEKILDEFVYMMDSIKADKKAGIINHSLQDHIDLAVGSVINSLLFGFRCSSNKKEDFNAQKEIIGATMKDLGRVEALVMQGGAHKFRFLPYFRKVYYDIQKNRDKTWAYFEENVQKPKVHEELSKFIGSDRLVTINDKPNLHYINAVVAETQRCCNLVNTNVFHRTLKDVKIHGYDIPKHTVIISHISSVLYDDRYFPDPYKFKPERFLDQNGIFSWPSELMPFGVGKRACLGESLARMELFLFIANLFNQFIFKENPDKPINDERHLCGTIAPQQYTCFVERRSYGY
uniref:Cytochrome P450 n=1 Tax=Panagrolaimus sp. ES5 TaxID=591445 RepID=A0AC34FDN5_9BILA